MVDLKENETWSLCSNFKFIIHWASQDYLCARVQVLRKSILKDGFQLEEYKKYFIGGEDTQTDLKGQVEFPQASVFKGLDL